MANLKFKFVTAAPAEPENNTVYFVRKPDTGDFRILVKGGPGLPAESTVSHEDLYATGTAMVQSVSGKSGVVVLDRYDVGLGNVNNTSDAAKPVSTAAQALFDTKAPKANPFFTGVARAKSGLPSLNLANLDESQGFEVTAEGTAETTSAAVMTFHRPGIFAGYFGLDTDNKWKVGGWSAGANSYAIYHEGYKPTKTDVGLPNVDNTSDLAKPISLLTQTALNAKAPLTGEGTSGDWGISITGSAGSVSWGNITNKPAVIAAGVDAAAARTAIGAGTSSLVIGTTAGSAKAGNYKPTISDVTDLQTTLNNKAPLTGEGASGSWQINITGTASYANVLKTTTGNWNTFGAGASVVGQLGWAKFGDTHSIFDASEGFSPNDVAVSNSNPDYPWEPFRPVLMGWNGVNTYGVRVDSARLADAANQTPWSGVTGKPTTFSGYGLTDRSRVTFAFVDKGTIAANGTINISQLEAIVFRIQAAGNLTITFSNLITGAFSSEFELHCVNFGGKTINWPAGLWHKSDGTMVSAVGNSGVVWQASGIDKVLVMIDNDAISYKVLR